MDIRSLGKLILPQNKTHENKIADLFFDGTNFFLENEYIAIASHSQLEEQTAKMREEFAIVQEEKERALEVLLVKENEVNVNLAAYKVCQSILNRPCFKGPLLMRLLLPSVPFSKLFFGIWLCSTVFYLLTRPYCKGAFLILPLS